jgi:hypothetical protein
VASEPPTPAPEVTELAAMDVPAEVMPMLESEANTPQANMDHPELVAETSSSVETFTEPLAEPTSVSLIESDLEACAERAIVETVAEDVTVAVEAIAAPVVENAHLEDAPVAEQSSEVLALAISNEPVIKVEIEIGAEAHAANSDEIPEVPLAEACTHADAISLQSSADDVLPPAPLEEPVASSDQGPATSDQGPATSDQGPVTSDQGPATSDQGPATSDQALQPVSEALPQFPERVSSEMAPSPIKPDGQVRRPWSRTLWVTLAGLTGGTLAGWWVSAQTPSALPLPVISPPLPVSSLPVSLPVSLPILRVPSVPPSAELLQIAEGPATQWCAFALASPWPLAVPWTACLPLPPWSTTLQSFAQAPSFGGLPPAALVVDHGWTWYAGGSWVPPSIPRLVRVVPELAFVEPLAVPSTVAGWFHTPDLRLVPVSVFAQDLGWTVLAQPALTAPVSLVVALPPMVPFSADALPVELPTEVLPAAETTTDLVEDFDAMLFGPDWSLTVEPAP